MDPKGQGSLSPPCMCQYTPSLSACTSPYSAYTCVDHMTSHVTEKASQLEVFSIDIKRPATFQKTLRQLPGKSSAYSELKLTRLHLATHLGSKPHPFQNNHSNKLSWGTASFNETVILGRRYEVHILAN